MQDYLRAHVIDRMEFISMEFVWNKKTQTSIHYPGMAQRDLQINLAPLKN